MYSPILRAVMGRRYTELVELLIDEGYVTRPKLHSAGHHATKFLLSPELQRCSWNRVGLESNAILKNIQRSWRKEQATAMDAIERDPVLRDLNDCLASVTVPESLSYSLVSDARPDPQTPPERMAYAKRQRAARAELCHQMLKRRDVLIVGTTGRVYSGLTNMPREFRRLVTLDGKHLTGVDVRNSQPLILAAFIQKARPQLAQAPDALRYKELCEQGTLYETVAERADCTREVVKEELFRQVFFGRCPKEDTPRRLVARAFAELFPTVWHFICAMKKRDHSSVAREMQRTESEIILHDAAAHLLRDGICVLTIHDSLVVRSDHVEQAERVIAEAFDRRGLRPTLHREPF